MTRSRLDLSEFDETPPNKDPAKLREISEGAGLPVPSRRPTCCGARTC